MASGLTTTTAASALTSRETYTKETPKTRGTHVQKCLKRLLVRIGETLKWLMSTSVGQWWVVRISGAQQWVMGSSIATNAASLAIFDPVTFCSLSQMVKFILRPV